MSVGSVTGAMVQVLAVAADAGGTTTRARARRAVVAPQIVKAGRVVLMTRSDSFGGPTPDRGPTPVKHTSGRDRPPSALGVRGPAGVSVPRVGWWTGVHRGVMRIT
ncbi:hypothetical protein GCM10009634_74000 [Saccharothrix xinjiangensis]